MRSVLRSIVWAYLLIGSPTSWAANTNPKVLLQTNIGQFVIELFPREAPITVKNFLDNVDNDFYSGTIFHSVVPGFFIQGGGLTSNFVVKKSRTSIKNEASDNLKNSALMVSMARAANNDSAATQFFINIQDNPSLDTNGKNAGYAVFGKVTEGADVVGKISLQPRGMYENFPEAPDVAVQILKIKRIAPNALITDVNFQAESTAIEPTVIENAPMSEPK